MTREEARKAAEVMLAFANGENIHSLIGEKKIGNLVLIQRSSSVITVIGYNLDQNTAHSKMRMNAGKK